MLRHGLTLLAAALVLLQGTAAAQTFSARRMAMGGVILAGRGPGADGPNVAYRAVPPGPGVASGVTLPIGLIPVLADPPELDPDDPDFNVYELADLLYNPPWNLQLVSPDPPSNDITIAIGKNSLAVELGDVADLFPEEGSTFGTVSNGLSYAIGIGPAFVGAGTLVHYENELTLNAPLHDALNGAPFSPNTTYALYDRGVAQAAVGIQLGWASPVLVRGDPRAAGGSGLYAGARVKILRGLAYADADNVVDFTTRDTLFEADPVDVNYEGLIRAADPRGGRLGRGLDLGAVWVSGPLELGLGVNDIGTRIDWRVRESRAFNDPVTGDYVQQELRDGAPFTSEVPTSAALNAALRLGGWLLAGDVVRAAGGTVGHLGAELWLGTLALRGGASLDRHELLQFSAGSGLRFGRLGVDVALATHSRNLSRERGLELAAGLAFYR